MPWYYDHDLEYGYNHVRDRNHHAADQTNRKLVSAGVGRHHLALCSNELAKTPENANATHGLPGCASAMPNSPHRDTCFL